MQSVALAMEMKRFPSHDLWVQDDFPAFPPVSTRVRLSGMFALVLVALATDRHARQEGMQLQLP